MSLFDKEERYTPLAEAVEKMVFPICKSMHDAELANGATNRQAMARVVPANPFKAATIRTSPALWGFSEEIRNAITQDDLDAIWIHAVVDISISNILNIA
jgi:hypothetical protein